MKTTPIRIAALLLVLGLSACGGGDDATSTPASPGDDSPAALTCDSTLFSTELNVPTTTQLAAYAKSYAGKLGSYDESFNFVPASDATLVFNANGTATFNGAAIDLKSVCFDQYEFPPGTVHEQIVIHWGTKVGNAYTSHVDLVSDGTATGSVDESVFKSPGTTMN